MQMTTEARAWLDATVRRILARHPLGDPERAGVTYELMSHLHAAGEARASAAGRTEVGVEDLVAALAEAGGDAGLAAAFVQPMAKPVQRVLFGRRVAAFALDALILGVALTFVHGALTVALTPIIGDVGPTSEAFTEGTFDDFWMPWGHHPVMSLWIQSLIAIASGALVLAYFTWFEAREGRSLGKRALELRVIRVDGQPLTYSKALIRNLVKVSPPLLVLDTIIMLVAFADDKQRVSDKIAETIVVRA